MTTVELTANAAHVRRSERLDRWTRVLCVLFFCSGFPALIYQLTWQRALFLIFGVNIKSVTNFNNNASNALPIVIKPAQYRWLYCIASLEIATLAVPVALAMTRSVLAS